MINNLVELAQAIEDGKELHVLDSWKNGKNGEWLFISHADALRLYADSGLEYQIAIKPEAKEIDQLLFSHLFSE